jgi:hypothetical protein
MKSKTVKLPTAPAMQAEGVGTLHGSAVLLFFLAACGSAGAASEAPDAGPAPGPDAAPMSDARPVDGCDKMDIVFVIDDSVSMQQEQDNLIANFPGFINVIENYETRSGMPLDYRIAVTTTGRDQRVGYQTPGFLDWVEQDGLNGAFVTDPECGFTKRWIDDDDPDPEAAFSCLASVGIGGPDIEMPLMALELALSDRVSDGTNNHFLRDDALLAFVVLTDEDDCSREDDGFVLGPPTYDCVVDDPALTELSHFTAFFDNLVGSRDRWTGAVIAGPGPDECESEFGDAEHAVRLQDFTAEAGDNMVFSSICTGDLVPALAEALQRFGDACETFPSID